VLVPGLLRRGDAGLKHLASFADAPQPGKQLRTLLIAGDVVGMRGDQLMKIGEGCVRISTPGAFQGQTVAREGIVRICGHEFFEHLAPRFLLLGGHAIGRIIGGSRPSAKFAGGRRFRVAQKSKERDRLIAGKLPGKPVSASRSEVTEVVLPQDTNVLGNILGGRVMHLVDITAAIAAHRHSNSHVVTASVDYVDFRNPIRVGELIILKSQVNRVFHSSMEIGVKVYSENVLTGERKHTTSAYVTFVAIDEERRPKLVPPLIVRTAEERRRYRDALQRRAIRLAHRNRRHRSD